MHKLEKPVLIRSSHPIFVVFIFVIVIVTSSSSSTHHQNECTFSPSPSFFSVFRSPKRSLSPKHNKNAKLEHDDPHAGPSIDLPEVEAVVFPSLLRTVSPNGRESNDHDGDGDVEVEEACRRFEKHLVAMIVEEGKMKDLMDVEELLRCWKKLKCPVFVDLVCRFYGELCKDLFPSQTIHDTT